LTEQQTAGSRQQSVDARGFFRSRWVRAPDGIEVLDPAQLAPGFRATGVPAGIKPSGKTDVGILVADVGGTSAALFTRNAAVAAPVQVCRERCDLGALRAVVVNSGNANAATGDGGFRDAVRIQESAARELGLDPRSVAVASTGVIGEPMPPGGIEAAIAAAAAGLDALGGRSFEEAIMTTDRSPKQCTLRAEGVTLSAQAKGAGMIEPGFATMLCFVQTDAQVPEPEPALRAAVGGSFERITVDGQLSTNDTVVLQATGAAGRPLPAGLLDAALLQLALEIVRDGEGAARVGRIQVREAADADEAERVARAIANSPLVKTALHGRDPNWGRIEQAAGMALAGSEPIELGPQRIDASELGGDEPEAEVSVDLGRGSATAHVYFSDLGCDYVRLNAEYTT
jgi:glutamate N-acetyltransferase/amino-acid N-acetyltransferase